MTIKQLINESLQGYSLPKKDGCGCGCNTCHLTDSKESIKEQIKPIIRQILSEDTTTTIIQLIGILTTDTKERNQKDIMSDIRSINGITIVSTRDIEGGIDKPNSYRTRVSIKIDPHPFIGKGGFTKESLQGIFDEIKRVTGVKTFKLLAKPKTIK